MIKNSFQLRDTVILSLMWMIPKLSPAMMQRIYMSNNVFQAKKSFTYAAVIVFIINVLVFFLGVLILTTHGDLLFLLESGEII